MRKIFLTLVAAAICTVASAQTKISGTVRDDSGKPVAGVVVSDGFSCVESDAAGCYTLDVAPDAYHIFYSVPASYKVNVKDGHPDFYSVFDRSVGKYDFTLTPLAGGVESKFKLICVADPQSQCEFHLKRLQRESIPDIRAYVDAQSLPCYGVTLGDLVYTEGKYNAVPLMPKVREALSSENTHLLFFQTMGNHDCACPPIETGEEGRELNLTYQREFEKVFGPVNYSWNRGDAHIVSMKNIEYLSAKKAHPYRPAFSKEQFEWLCQDLKYVPRNKMVILCVHIGMYERQNPYLEEVRALLAEFKESHLMVGHTHFMNNKINKKGTYEHVHAALSGAYWWSCTNGDGVPNGYTIYDVDGAHISNWQYKGVGHDIDYQIRMYRGDAEFGGEYETFKYPYSHDTILANVFMADENWKVQLFENGVLTGDMERIPVSKDSVPEVGTSRDWWAVGYHLGVIGRSYGKVKTGKSKMNGGGRKGYLTQCNHLYRLQLKNPKAKKIKVVATDTNGNVYTQTRFTKNFDYSENAIMNKLYKTPRKVLDKTY